jgi:hypothetical protein
MPTTDELGQLVKRKYPGKYEEYSDWELGNLVKEKYPGKYDEYSDALEVYSRELSPPRADVLQFFQPHSGRLSLWWANKKSESRGRLLQSLSKEQALVLEQGARLERVALESRQNEVSFKRFVAENAEILYHIKIRAELAEKAAEEGFNLDNHQQVKMAQAMSRVKIDELTELKALDLDTRWKEIIQDSDAADLAQIGEYLVIKKLRHELREARKERYAIKTGDDPEELKQELVADYDKFISRLEAKIDERETGHLLPENRETPRRLTEGKNQSRADYPPETDEDSI